MPTGICLWEELRPAILRQMARKLSVTIIGPGSLGGALAFALHRFSIPVSDVVYRTNRPLAVKISRKIGANAVRFRDFQPTSDLVWLCVADREIASTAESLRDRADWKERLVFHSSGALSADELSALKQRGASVASVHPMMSFVRSAKASFEHVVFAVEGDPSAIKAAAQIIKALKATWFVLNKKDKPLYHALGAFSSPLFIAHLAATERVGRKLGLKPEQTRRVIAPILKQTVTNYLEHGTAAALSGPLTRGDLETVASHLRALKSVPGAVEIYRALVKVALQELPVKNKAAITKLLDLPKS